MATRRSKSRDAIAAVHVRIGGWFEASATGWGVLAVPLLLLILLAASLVLRLGVSS